MYDINVSFIIETGGLSAELDGVRLLTLDLWLGIVPCHD
jgi:hypothetical protein